MSTPGMGSAGQPRRVPDKELLEAVISGSVDPDVLVDLTPDSLAHSSFTEPSNEANPGGDPYFVPAWTKGLDATRDALLGKGAGRVVRNIASEPGVSEFSFGKGQMAPLELADPSQTDELRALYRSDPANGDDALDYRPDIRERP